MGKKLYKKDTLLSEENCQVITDDGSGLTKEELARLKILSVPVDCKVLGENPKNFNSNENLDDFFRTIKTTHAKKIVTSIDQDKVNTILHSTLKTHKFVIFAGTGESFSSINEKVRKSLEFLSRTEPDLRAKNRLIILNTSCVSGGLGFYLYRMTPFIYSGAHSVGEVFAYNQFLANHIVHEFSSNNFDFVEESRRFSELDSKLTKRSFKDFFISSSKEKIPLMYVPRTGKINPTGEIFRGRRALAHRLISKFHSSTFTEDAEVWIVFGGLEKDETFKRAKDLAHQLKRFCPNAKIDLSHRLTPAICAHAGDEVIGLVYLSKSFRPDETEDNDFQKYRTELEEKTKVMKRYITKISHISQLHSKSTYPDLTIL